MLPVRSTLYSDLLVPEKFLGSLDLLPVSIPVNRLAILEAFPQDGVLVKSPIVA